MCQQGPRKMRTQIVQAGSCMIRMVGKSLLASVAALSLGGCYYYGDVAGYDSYYDPYYSSYPGTSFAYTYFGWYDDFYYPGVGVHVFDRYGHRHRWSDRHRQFWEGRRGHYRGHREDWSGFSRGHDGLYRDQRRGERGGNGTSDFRDPGQPAATGNSGRRANDWRGTRPVDPDAGGTAVRPVQPDTDWRGNRRGERRGSDTGVTRRGGGAAVGTAPAAPPTTGGHGQRPAPAMQASPPPAPPPARRAEPRPSPSVVDFRAGRRIPREE